ncbi:Anti-sigma-K factor rskA [Jatrophihabitans endophyticus]|uniref:Anti-sigma-K factor rskA n=1 Tax=Jatrophihabitans endophyticus TaxID=1206085 RepID=A0A1M5BVY5_9ACTN|nr:anti-sigma factor [Jatrophihabitans endophyticus]SHF46688.1 Anti-sigma-K factor rskA [Jatrophihabitans endophyticus]
MSTPHISEDLPRLLTGDATRDVVLGAAHHLRTCVDCQQELVSAVVAHASLSSAHRFAPEIVAPERDDRPVAGPDEDVEGPGALPDLSTVFAEARADAHASGPRAGASGTAAAPAGTRTRRRLIAVAAAAAIVAGGGVTYAVATSGDDAPATQTVALDGPASTKSATAKLVGDDRMSLDASVLPALRGGRQYEVWLTDGLHKQSVGFLQPDRHAALTIPSTLMKRYDSIAVSVQKDGQTEFSGDVVLRGSYS